MTNRERYEQLKQRESLLKQEIARREGERQVFGQIYKRRLPCGDADGKHGLFFKRGRTDCVAGRFGNGAQSYMRAQPARKACRRFG